MDEATTKIFDLTGASVDIVFKSMYNDIRTSSPRPKVDMVLPTFQRMLKEVSDAKAYPQIMSLSAQTKLKHILNTTDPIRHCHMSVADVWHNVCVYTARNLWRKPDAIQPHNFKLFAKMVEFSIGTFVHDLWKYAEEHAPPVIDASQTSASPSDDDDDKQGYSEREEDSAGETAAGTGTGTEDHPAARDASHDEDEQEASHDVASVEEREASHDGDERESSHDGDEQDAPRNGDEQDASHDGDATRNGDDVDERESSHDVEERDASHDVASVEERDAPHDVEERAPRVDQSDIKMGPAESEDTKLVQMVASEDERKTKPSSSRPRRRDNTKVVHMVTPEEVKALEKKHRDHLKKVRRRLRSEDVFL